MTAAYPIPAAALDDRLGFVGTSGSGKTYNAMTAVEALVASGARVVILDALDVWWGLRLRVDGKKPSGLNIPIFGGPHGDLPINEHAGALIGETVAGMAESSIISLRGLPSQAATRRFVLALLRALHKHHRGGLFHLVIDEADLWAPQVVMDREGDAMKLKGLMSDIVRRARVDGFIPWLITQRSAIIDKDILSMVDGLIAFKMTSSQDRAALGKWVDGQADRETGNAILASLPTLQTGQGVVWLPSHGILTTQQFPLKKTFDSSRAPKRGEVITRADLKPLDLGALRERLANIDADAKANDPSALKAEVRRLSIALAKAERQVKAAPAPAPAAAPVIANQEALDAARKDGELTGIAIGIARAQQALAALRVDGGGDVPAPAPRVSRSTAAPRPRQSQAAPADGSVPVGCAKPLASLASVYPAGMTEAQWATAAGYKRSGGTWGTYRSRLRGAGLIDQKDGRWFATEAGAAAAGDVELPPGAGPDLVRWWASRLPGTSRIAEALISAWPSDMGREDLALAVNMSAAGGSFGTYLSRLASPGLIERDGGFIRLSAEAMGPKP